MESKWLMVAERDEFMPRTIKLLMRGNGNKSKTFGKTGLVELGNLTRRKLNFDLFIFVIDCVVACTY